MLSSLTDAGFSLSGFAVEFEELFCSTVKYTVLFFVFCYNSSGSPKLSASLPFVRQLYVFFCIEFSRFTKVECELGICAALRAYVDIA